MAQKKREHPKFRRPNYGRSSRSRIKIAWRRQRGIDNKKRAKIAYMGCSPSIGYGQPTGIKYNHPQGLKELLAQSPADLAGAANVVIRIAAGVGAVKREAIQKLAEQMKLKVVNARKFVPRVPKPKKGEKPAEVKEQKPTQAAVKEQPKAAAPAAKVEQKPAQAAKEEPQKTESAKPAATSGTKPVSSGTPPAKQ